MVLDGVFRGNGTEVAWIGLVAAVAIVAILALRRVIDGRRPEHAQIAGILHQTRNALITLIAVLAIRLGLVILDTNASEWAKVAEHVLTIAFIVATVWFVSEVIVATEGVLLTRFSARPGEDDVRSRKATTQIIMLRRLLVAIVITFGVAAVLMTFPAVRVVGQGLLASAGLISIVAGLAAQTLLANVFAGIQLALSDSLRVGDVVKAEEESGTVGEITLTYVVLYLWDDRRLILPSSYFTTTPFENWTRRGDRIDSVVQVQVDWTVPLDDLRGEYLRALGESSLWDRRSAAMAVTDISGGNVTLRFWTSAATTSDMFGLNGLVRETVVRFMASRGGAGIPRLRREDVTADS